MEIKEKLFTLRSQVLPLPTEKPTLLLATILPQFLLLPVTVSGTLQCTHILLSGPSILIYFPLSSITFTYFRVLWMSIFFCFVSLLLLCTQNRNL